jgi:HEXXH motif-containing protein
MSEITKAVAAALSTPGPLWFPSLAPELATNEWRRLEEVCGLSPLTYGLDRVRACSPNAPRDILVTVALPARFKPQHFESILVERSHLAEAHYRSLGLDFYAPVDLEASTVERKTSDALDLLGSVTDVLSVIGCLVRTIHILRPPAPEYDVSHSDPTVPFSIFVSIPSTSGRVASLRLGEAILHEAMHLQLSLVEAVTPLIARSNRPYYSPWKKTNRPLQGVFHGLYVFAVIDSFLAEAERDLAFCPLAMDYLHKRRSDIRGEFKQIRSKAFTNELTPLGMILMKRVFRQFS